MSDLFNSLGDLLKAGLERAGLKGAIKERTAISIWPEIVGAKTASVTRVEQVRDGILYVNCRDSMWAQQLHFLRPMIIEKLNERLGGKVIREIRLSGKGYSKSSKLEEEDCKPEKSYKMPELSKEDINTIEKAASKIENHELAERVKRSLKAGRALKRKFEE